MPRLLRLLVFVCIACATLGAAAQTARFSGQIVDPQHAAIPGAEIEVVNLGSHVRLSTKTDASGNFTVPYLAAGSYQIEVRVQGFNTSISKPVEISVGQVFLYNLQLTLGASETSVQVEGRDDATTVELANAEISGIVTEKEVKAIGLNGRNFSQLIALVPGVSNQTQQDEARVGLAGSVSYSVNGGRTEYNSFQVDGSELLNVGINKDHTSLIVTPSIDSIQEIKVLTSNYGAQYPSTGNATTIVTTKSGTDSLRGSVYEFLRNEAVNAKGYFDIGKNAPVYRRNDFGGTIGGPIVIPKLYDGRGKTHFFVSEEFRLEKDPYPFRQAVPSDSERTGDFLDLCPAAYAPYNPSEYPDCPQLLGYSLIQNADAHTLVLPHEGNFLNRNATAILSTGIIPRANAKGGCNGRIVQGSSVAPANCYLGEVSLPTSWREDLLRVDHRVSERLLLSLRYIHDDWSETVPSPLYGYLVNSFPTVQTKVFGPGTAIAIRVTSTLNSSLLNEFIASYTNSRIKLTNVPGQGASLARPQALDAACAVDPLSEVQTGENAALQCPIGSLFNNGYGGKLPGVVIAGTNAAYGGQGFTVDQSYIPWLHSNPTYSFTDNVTKVIKTHSLQIGAQWVIYQRNQTNGPIGGATGETQGIITFSNQKGQYSTGNSFADFLLHQATGTYLGQPVQQDAVASFQQDSSQGRYRQRYELLEPYIQDDWRATPRLTLNLGVRLSLLGTFHDISGQTYNWVPAGAYGPGTGYDAALAATVGVNGDGSLGDRFTGAPLTLNPSDPTKGIDPRIVNGLVRCGKNGVPESCMEGHLFNPAPRVGLAWDPRGQGKMAIRAGYGFFFEHGTADEANTGSLEGGSPVVLDMIQNNPTSWNTIGGGLAFPLNVASIPTKVRWPYVQQWSLSFEQELPQGLLATFAYVGSKGTHLTTQRQINQLLPLPTGLNPFGLHEPINRRGVNTIDSSQTLGDCPTQGGGYLENGTYISAYSQAWVNLTAACYGTAPVGSATLSQTVSDPNSLRQLAVGFGQIYELENTANSAYSGFQATLRRTKGSLDASVAYTYSHSLDDASDRSDTTFVNAFDPRSNRASSNFDQRHLLHISYVYTLPQYRGDLAIARGALSGWRLSGVTLYETGIPFTIVNGGSSNGLSALDNAGVANGTGSGSYPDLVASPGGKRPAGGDNTNSFGPLLLNSAAFVAPRGLTFGTAGRNVVNNPSRLNFDMAVLRTFKLPREADLEFRAESFNTFNHTQFRIYNPTMGNQANNTVSCYGDAAANYSAGAASCLSGSSFLHPIDAHRPRTLQLALKLSF